MIIFELFRLARPESSVGSYFFKLATQFQNNFYFKKWVRNLSLKKQINIHEITAELLGRFMYRPYDLQR